MTSTARADRSIHVLPAKIGTPGPRLLTPHQICLSYAISHQAGKGRLAPRRWGSEEASGYPLGTPDRPWRVVGMKPVVRVPAPALGPVARTITGEERVGVGPDVKARQLRLEPGQVTERVVLAAEHHHIRAAPGLRPRGTSRQKGPRAGYCPSKRPSRRSTCTRGLATWPRSRRADCRWS